MSRAVLTLSLLACLTFFAGLGRQAITDSDEAYYAEAAREMVVSGDWLSPRYNYVNRWEKPVLYYWLAASAYLVFGVSEGAARLPSALAGLGLVLLTWSIARTTSSARGDARAREADATAWLAGAIVATCYGYFNQARFALPDLLLTLWITLTIWAAWRAAVTDRLAWWLVTGAAAGLGLVTKGPVAVVLPALVVLPVWWLDRGHIRLRVSGIVLAIGLCLAIGVPWYVAMWRTHGEAYVRVFFLDNNVRRFATEEYNDARPIWYYLPIVIGGLLPWSAYLVAFTLTWSARVVRREAISRPEWQLALWASMPLLFYTASIGKQPRYILPVLPPLAILMAGALTRRIRQAGDAHPSRALTIATWASAALFVGLAMLLTRAQPIFIDAYRAITWTAIAALAFGGVAIAAIAATRAWTRLPSAMAAAATVLLLAIQFGALSGRRPEAVEQMAALVRMHRVADERVGEYHNAFVRNLVFYLGFKQQDLFDDATALAFLQSPDRVLFVASASDVDALQRKGASLRVLGSVPYLNAANLKLQAVFRPDVERDVNTLVLATNR